MTSVAEADFDSVLKDITESIPADKIDDLGTALGFKYTQIENFVATNKSGASFSSAGTLKMLREWRDKQTNPDEKAALRKCLEDAGLNRLANLPILQGDQKQHHQATTSSFTGPTASSPASSGRQQVPVENPSTSASNVHSTNSLQDSSSTSITRSRNRKTACTQSAVTDNISGIPEKHVRVGPPFHQVQPSRTSQDSHQTSPIPTPGVASSAVDPEDQPKPPRTVSELEYLKLARSIGANAYHDIGIHLGRPYYECGKVLLQSGNNYTNALMDIFMKWNIQQEAENTNIREVVAEVLQKSELGDLANKLRRGCLVPK